MPQILPIEIRRLTDSPVTTPAAGGTGLHIRWSDGATSEIDSRTLRINCPCASCLQKRGDTTHDKPLSSGRSLLTVVKSDAAQEGNLQEVWPVGRYAIGMRWGDGHDTGIYPYELLRMLVARKPAA